ncbi:L-rhamnose mutarotase [Treponema sp. OMZ 840]|uniref:L-rhamnose mutarotase n=1 Tax=Treponema sp. OMZ 840 TaxID=244313 RepID=UPI003D89E389
MLHTAFKMKLKPGFAAEYKKRHDKIWPELKDAITKSGVYDYSIFLDEDTLTLFAYQKLKPDNTAFSQKDLPIVKEWWNMMADIMEVNSDNSPVCTELKNVFYME